MERGAHRAQAQGRIRTRWATPLRAGAHRGGKLNKGGPGADADALSQVNDNLDTPVRLNAIRVIGAEKTRPSFLSTLLAPYLPNLPPASYLSSTPHPRPSSQTLRGVLNTTRNVSGLLSQFDIFSQVEASLEASPSVLAEAEDVDIVLRVKEGSRYFLRTATDIGDGEGNAVSSFCFGLSGDGNAALTVGWDQTATARVRNAFGGAETLEGNLSFGTRTKSAFQVRSLLCLVPLPF